MLASPSSCWALSAVHQPLRQVDSFACREVGKWSGRAEVPPDPTTEAGCLAPAWGL